MLPVSVVSRLSDFEGRFVLSIQCLECGHESPIAAHNLAQKCGRNTLVTAVVKRLRCSECGGRRVDVGVVGIQR